MAGDATDASTDTSASPGDGVDDGRLDAAREALDKVRAQLAEVPAQVVVANHAMGLYELAAIHLSASPPRLPDAALAIDALACLVDGLGDRLGSDIGVLRDALANIRLAFVRAKGSLTTS